MLTWEWNNSKCHHNMSYEKNEHRNRSRDVNHQPPMHPSQDLSLKFNLSTDFAKLFQFFEDRMQRRRQRGFLLMKQSSCFHCRSQWRFQYRPVRSAFRQEGAYIVHVDASQQLPFQHGRLQGFLERWRWAIWRRGSSCSQVCHYG